MNVRDALDAQLGFFQVRATQLGTATRSVVARLFGVGVTGGSDEQQEPIEEAECFSPIGFKSRPKVGAHTEAVVMRQGDEVHVLFFVDKSGPTLASADLDEGEAIAYSPAEPSAVIKLDKLGGITITAKTGQPIKLVTAGAGEIQLHGGAGYAGKELARKDDAVDGGTLYFNPGMSGATLTYSPPGGAPGVGTPLAIAAKVAAGAPNAKG